MVFQRWPVIIAVCMWVCVCTRLCVGVCTHVHCVRCMAACAGQRITIIPSVLATFSSSDFIFIIILYICDNGDTSLCHGACGGQRITFGSQFTSSTWVLRSNSGWQAWWQSPFPPFLFFLSQGSHWPGATRGWMVRKQVLEPFLSLPLQHRHYKHLRLP